MDDDDDRDIIETHDGVVEQLEDEDDLGTRPRELPQDLPRSLDDRRNYPSFNQETEYYDAWQGEEASSSKYCTRLIVGLI